MNFAEMTIKKRTFFLFLTVCLIGIGYMAYEKLGRLENPVYTIKTAVVVTQYPGATPLEVEQEVTDPLERAIQQLGQLDEVRSFSRDGLSFIYVDIKDNFGADDLPQIWDELRRKVSAGQADLPPGARPSIVNDDFGDVFGVYYAFYGDGYEYSELQDYIDMLKKELLLVDDVAKVEVYGEQIETIYIEARRSKMAQLGISPGQIVQTFQQQNLVVDEGKIRVGDEYVSVNTSGIFRTVEEIGDMLIRSSSSDKMIHLKDIAEIKRGYYEQTRTKLRFNRKPAIGLGISTVKGGNVVNMGKAVAERLAELEGDRPIGIERGTIAYQSGTVEKAVDGFVLNLVEAVGIVVVILLIFMGLRVGLLIGAILLITILTTFIGMRYMQVELQNISLGALIIALGMLVDNAIVVSEGILIKIQMGRDRLEAAVSTVKETMWPLLGATVIAIMAFVAIAVSDDSTGEFLVSLFQVIGSSLMLSWVFAITLTPLFCHMVLRPKKGGAVEDPYSGGIYVTYKRMLSSMIKFRWVTIAVVVGCLVVAIYGFGFVKQSFFPDSTRPQLMINMWMREGLHIDATEKIVAKAENELVNIEHVEDVISFVGAGGLRFLLTYQPEQNNSAYAQIVLSLDDYREIDNIIPQIKKIYFEKLPEVQISIKKFQLGPGSAAKIEARFSGKDPQILRNLSEQAMDIMRRDDASTFVSDDWRQKVKTIDVKMAEAQAKSAGITRSMVNDAIKASFTGTVAGLFRENNDLIPIVFRSPADERANVDSLLDLQVFSTVHGRYVPIQQVVEGVETGYGDSVIRRKNRSRTITAKCDPQFGTANALFQRLRPQIEAIPLPDGYTMEWGGEYENSTDAQKKLIANVPGAFLVMVLIMVLLFNRFKQPLIIIMTLPMALVGVSAGLLIMDKPFGFMALLGFLSLSGMLIKNAIVLLDQIDIELAGGKEQLDAVIDASVSRIRPVAMAALTTILGMAPLIVDAFFASMAVAIMFGLAFATVLTLIFIPVMYTVLYRVKWRRLDS
ncbi:MAG: AcrB/AcrD/AcrF family protein [Denitrovibrio sp.]|nr:MAG: AcrB/AcrD/AcrF family protein [Denitrovibrio sp.]